MSNNEPPSHPNTSCVPLGADCVAHDMPMLCPHRCEHGAARDNAYGTTCGCDDLTDREIARTRATRNHNRRPDTSDEAIDAIAASIK